MGGSARMLSAPTSRPRSTATTTMEMSSNLLPKQSTSHHHPFIFTKSNTAAAWINHQVGNECICSFLLKQSITIYSDGPDISIKTAGLKGILFYNVYWLAKEDKGLQGGYKDGLQPESLADGNWLVKQNQPVSKIETKSDTNLRSLYESWFRNAKRR